jgi:hypothetical protein
MRGSNPRRHLDDEDPLRLTCAWAVRHLALGSRFVYSGTPTKAGRHLPARHDARHRSQKNVTAAELEKHGDQRPITFRIPAKVHAQNSESRVHIVSRVHSRIAAD